MNGYSLHAHLRKTRRRYTLNATEQALYYELVAICNEERWASAFNCSNNELANALGGIGEKTLNTARQSLVNAGLIIYKSGKGRRHMGTYTILEVEEKEAVTDKKTEIKPVVSLGILGGDLGGLKGGFSGGDLGGVSDEKTTDLYKHKEKEKEKQEEKASLPLSPYAVAWAELLESRKKRKAPNTPYALKLIENRLEKWSGGNEQAKVDLLNRSVERGWITVFEPEKEQTEYSKQQGKAPSCKNVTVEY